MMYGLLIADDRVGTILTVEATGRIDHQAGRSNVWDLLDPVGPHDVEVSWPAGYTARWNSEQQIEVVNEKGYIVVTTGHKYALSECFEQATGAFSACGVEATGNRP